MALVRTQGSVLFYLNQPKTFLPTLSTTATPSVVTLKVGIHGYQKTTKKN